MRFTKTRRAVALLLLFTMLLTVMPLSVFAEEPDHTEEPVVTEEIVAAETTPPETAVPTEAPEDPPATDTAATEPVDNEAETAAEEATAPALETTEDPNLAWNTQPSDGVTAVDDQGRLIRSTSIGGHGSLGWAIYPKQGAYAYTHSWIYANGNSATTTFGENGHFLLLNYLTPNGTPPNTVLDYENNPVVYCIQPEKATVTGRAYWSEALTDVLSSEQIEAIKILCAYGWPWGYTDQPNGKMNTDDETAFQYQAATQILIWEVVMGIRSATPAYYVTDSRLYEVYNGTPTYQTYGDNSAFITAYQEIAARLLRHNTIPSFANASASNAATYAMSYNGSNYTLTLTDINGVLDLDYSNFSAPDGISVSKSGNSLTITATPAALENGDQTITMTGKKLRAGFQNIWVNGQGDQYLTSLDSASKIPAYFKLRADTKTISLKKTSSASASVAACIQGNPRYTLQGAVYEIRQGSATGPVVETLTTDANGNATGTVKYAVNTVLYAVEKTAPAGYKLNSTPVLLTVSADSSQNVFNVSDVPTFDPQRLEIKKTGTSSEYIPNTIFKADFYASTWMDSNYLQRTWYLKSDSNGRVRVDDAHLLSSYGGNSSDPLFKPDGTVSFPLGCVYIQEIQAADGYITPVGNDAGVLIFINQPTSGGAADAYWGDAAGQPITTQNPTGIYKMENDSDQQIITAVNRLQTELEIVKSSTDGAVGGIQFEVEKLVDEAWTMLGSYTTNADGKISVETEQLSVGAQFRIREIVPQDYVCTSDNPQTITLAEGLNTVSFANKPVGRLEIIKTSTDGKVAGISFKVEKEVSGSWTALGTYKTDANGKIQIPNLDVGQKLRITETVPADYVCLSENPQTVTLKKGLNTVSFANRLLPSGHTVAANSETMGHYAYDLPSVDLEDAFYYENLISGDRVTLIGFAKIVYEDETGETVVEDLLDADGVPVSCTVTFMAEQGNGVVTIPFPGLDLSRLGGKRIVFGERMYVNEQILVEHFDEADELQTIYVKSPSGHTTATVDATESHYTYITPEVEITDRYFYHDLMPGEHTVVGYPVRVIQAEDGTLIEEPVMVDGKPMEVPVTFTVEENAPDGYVDIHFTIPGTEMQGTKIVIGEDLYFNGKKIQHHFDVNDEDQTVYPVIPEMGTTATVNGQHITYPVGMIAMQDVVGLRNILPGTYRCEGQIMVKIKENGKTLAKPLLVDGKPVIASQEITVEAADGKPQSVTVTMRFDEFDAELVRGLETVVFEKLFQIDGDEETETVTHENPEDEDQTVRFPDFKFRTVATAKGEHRVEAYGVLAPQDEVIYTEAIPGTTLIASATLMERVELLDKVYLVPFLVDGKTITGETTITVEKANGSLIVKFPAFDVGKLAGRKLVVVEEMFTLDASGKRIKLGEERDAENKEQTIEFYAAPTPPSPNTGDDPSLFWLWLFMFLGAVGAITSATALIRTKQRG